MIVALPHPVEVTWIPRFGRKIRVEHIETISPFEIKQAKQSDFTEVGSIPKLGITYFEMDGQLWAREAGEKSKDIVDRLTQGLQPSINTIPRGSSDILQKSPLMQTIHRDFHFPVTYRPRYKFSSGEKVDLAVDAKRVIKNDRMNSQSAAQKWLDDNLRIVDGFVMTRRPPPLYVLIPRRFPMKMSFDIAIDGFDPKPGLIFPFFFDQTGTDLIGTLGAIPFSSGAPIKPPIADLSPFLSAEDREIPLRSALKYLVFQFADGLPDMPAALTKTLHLLNTAAKQPIIPRDEALHSAIAEAYGYSSLPSVKAWLNTSVSVHARLAQKEVDVFDIDSKTAMEAILGKSLEVVTPPSKTPSHKKTHPARSVVTGILRRTAEHLFSMSDIFIEKWIALSADAETSDFGDPDQRTALWTRMQQLMMDFDQEQTNPSNTLRQDIGLISWVDTRKVLFDETDEERLKRRPDIEIDFNDLDDVDQHQILS